MDKKQPMEQSNSQIKVAVDVGQTFLEQYDNSDKSNKCWHLYDALLQLTSNDLEKGYDEIDCRYNYEELYTFISERNEGYKVTGEPQKKVSTLYRNLEKKLAETPQDHVAKELGLDIKPKIIRHSPSGRNHKATLWIEAESLNDEETKSSTIKANQLPTEVQANNSTQRIQYYLEKTPKLPFWSRWAENLEFIGWTRAALIIYAILPGALLSTFALSLILIPILQKTFILHVALYSIAGFVIYYLFFGSILKAFKNNIAIVPDTLIPLRLHSAVFELDIEKNPKKIGQRIKKLNIKVYSAKCPVCESKVHLKKGGLMHWGRIIGECDLNPVEHIYSFDHTNLKGVNLR